jgi:hypothetical protein
VNTVTSAMDQDWFESEYFSEEEDESNELSSTEYVSVEDRVKFVYQLVRQYCNTSGSPSLLQYLDMYDVSIFLFDKKYIDNLLESEEHPLF